MTVRLPKGLLIGLGVFVLAAAAVVAGLLLIGGEDDDSADEPPPLNVPVQAGVSYRALTDMTDTRVDYECYDTLDFSFQQDAACAEHWAADAQSAASESSIWNTAIFENRVPARYLDVAHAFKDVFLEASHAFDDLRLAIKYQNLQDYYAALAETDKFDQMRSDLDATLRAAGIDPDTLASAPPPAEQES